MTPWAHHLASRWTAAFRTPKSCFLGFAAAFMVSGTPANTNGGATAMWSDAVLVAMQFLAASGFAAASGGGASSNGRSPGFAAPYGFEMRDWPQPALPLHPGVRALMEALAGFGVMFAWQIALAAAAPLSSSLGFDLAGSFVGYLSRTARTGLWAGFVIVPGAMAGLLPAPNKVIYLLRQLIVMILATAAIVISLNSLPLVLVVAAALVAALLGTARIAMIPAPFARSHASRSSGQPVTSMFRAPRPPLGQLWRDASLGPLRVTRWVLVASAACLGLSTVLSRAHRGPEVLVYMLGAVPSLLVATALVWCPLGTPASAAGRGVAAGLFNASNGLAWIRLPLRREWVMRAFYAHGMATGLAFVALDLLGGKITGGPGPVAADMVGDAAGLPGLLCAVPPFAGFLTCRAAGDRVRGAISLASFLLILFEFPSLSTGLAAALAVAGGAPPLVHLFDRRSTTTTSSC